MTDHELEDVAGDRAARVRWALRLLESGGAAVAADELAAALAGVGPFGQHENFGAYLAFWNIRIGPHRLAAVRRGAGDVIEVILLDQRARRWRLDCGVEFAPPHRLTRFEIQRELPAGVAIRRATVADADAIASIERGSAIVRDDGVRVTIVRGAQLFDQLRLMDAARVFLAEDNGTPIACEAIGAHRARVGGQLVTLLYRHHTRVLPSHQRIGLNDAFSARVNEFAQTETRPDSGYVYTDPHNEAVREWQASASGAHTWRIARAWNYRPFRALLRCAAVSGTAAGHAATRADAARIVALVNACHEREEMFLPYDAGRLASRLDRLPESYGWARVWLEGEAVVGVWESGELCVRDENGKTTESVRAYVLDYGFDPQRGLRDFERLLRAWCARLADRGVTHLSIFSSPASLGSELIRDLAEAVVEVQFQCRLGEPPDVSERGFYVDHVYF
ncbi:MAG: hypothetical protein HYR72_07450 [Deltaproteobacteria bacterium]|nr:hypothetical protein [Deltaproteobacteria bacterium]MBI3386924.1 hypothetical protein [Deltaproteobacteria bacterium]